MSETLRVGVMASGGGTNLQSIIDACQSGKCPAEVVVVVSDREEAFALERARRYGIAAVHIPVGKTGSEAWARADEAQVDVLREHDVQLVCLAGYMRITGPTLLAAYPRAVLNIHPALLPAFPGVHVQAMAADHGVKIAGTTVHFADPVFDTGPIIIQAAVPVLDSDDGSSLGARILEQEHRIYPQAIKWFAEGRLQIEGRKVRVLDLHPEDPALYRGSAGRAMINPPLDTDF
jgi:phosphoribosylglycinamide formyltransferase 1